MISASSSSTPNLEVSSTSGSSEVVFELLTDWGSSCHGKLFITNTTNESIKDWTFEFNLDI